MGGPCPVHYHLHQLKNLGSSNSDRLYQEILAPFSQVVFLFVADVGGLEATLDFLTTWIYSSRLVPGKSRILLILDGSDNVTISWVWFEISLRLLGLLRLREPAESYSVRHVQNIGYTYLDLDIVPHFSKYVLSQKSLRGSGPYTNFEGRQLPFLFHEALAHFAKTTSPFNASVAYSAQVPLPHS